VGVLSFVDVNGDNLLRPFQAITRSGGTPLLREAAVAGIEPAT
jgi:hypothetical protein